MELYGIGFGFLALFLSIYTVSLFIDYLGKLKCSEGRHAWVYREYKKGRYIKQCSRKGCGSVEKMEVF